MYDVHLIKLFCQLGMYKVVSKPFLIAPGDFLPNSQLVPFLPEILVVQKVHGLPSPQRVL